MFANAKEAEEILFLSLNVERCIRASLVLSLVRVWLSREDRLLQVVFNSRWKLNVCVFRSMWE